MADSAQTLEEVKKIQFLQLTNFLEEWFYMPDIDALKICLSVYAAHTYLTEDPVWLFVIGASGSGKTSVAIRALEFLENTHKVADLTTKSFSSGFGNGTGILGMLDSKHSGKGVILFPDFTTILSKHDHELKTIAGQMRQIYDGSYSDWKGNKDEAVTWEGKVTCIAAVTPALEEHWSINRSLGERFMYLRWKSGDPLETARYASRQIGHRVYIREEFKRLVTAYVNPQFKPVTIAPEIEEGMRGLANLVARLRTNVRREGNRRIVIGVDESEIPTRVANALGMISIGAATLDRKSIVDALDLDLAKRVAMDSIPKHRGTILNLLITQRKYDYNTDFLQRDSKIPKATFDRVIEELVLLGAVREVGINTDFVEMTEPMIANWESAIIANVDMGEGIVKAPFSPDRDEQ